MSFYVKLGEKKTVLEKMILVLEMFLILQYNKGYNSLIVLSEVSLLHFSESLSLFKVLSPSFIFTWTAVTNNAFEICKNASYCCARKYETWRPYSE